MKIIPLAGYPRRVGRMVEYAPGRFRDYSLHIEAEKARLREMGIKTLDQLREHLKKEEEEEKEETEE